MEPVTSNNRPSHKGNSIVLQPEEGDSYWQPTPTGGYATIKISPENCCSNFLSMGVQAIAEGGYVREHWHAKHEEILFCFEGEGEVLVDGARTASFQVPPSSSAAGSVTRSRIPDRVTSR
ncbi:MAG TPA: hypothetical protein VH325_16905 [Bryobacteraceae bacterium]|jgi:oxalate decarboxylase/phosphoglucose isomerase-like protein (cupin superfamily)|nr:hypothetical protein [Bryobacteraceae bacterium]